MTMPSPPKLLIQMSGAPGSGKTSIAAQLAQSIDGVVINHDLIKSFFLEMGNAFDQSAKLTYRLQWVLAEDMIKQGRSVVMDSTCNYKETLESGVALAQQYNYSYKYVECRADDIDLLEQRLHERVPLRSQRRGVNSPPPDATGAARYNDDCRAVFRRWIQNPCRPIDDAILVDSTASPEQSRDYILKHIGYPSTL